MHPELIEKWATLNDAERLVGVQVLEPAQLLKMLIMSEITARDIAGLPPDAFKGEDALPELSGVQEFLATFLPVAYQRVGELLTR